MEERDHFSQQPNTAMAGWALALGIVSLFMPIRIIDLILAITGIVLANKAKQTGVGGLATAALVVSIIGTALTGLLLIGILLS